MPELGTIMALIGSSTNSLKSAIMTIENEIDMVETTSVPFSVDNSYIDANGVVQSATGYATTDFIDITDADAVSFAGVMGTVNTVNWYASDKSFVSGTLNPNSNFVWFYNILQLKPATAKYVRLTSKKSTTQNPLPTTPEVTVFKGKKYIEYLAANIVGDGVTDDTMAVQRIVNMGNKVVFPNVEKIKLTSTVNVTLGYSKIIDGMNATLIATGNFYALTVKGTLTSSAAPGSVGDFILKSEGGTTIKNFKITNTTATQGGGIDVSKAFNLKIMDCYIYNCNNGIRFWSTNRDIVISGNHIFAINSNGILFDELVNLHQCNIINNMIMFALNDIHIYEPLAIANFQIVGNDIEIVNYPSTGYNVAKCICFESTTQEPSMFGEIEISGNTIEGHETSDYIMYFSGHASEPIMNMSITGNMIGNSQDCAVYLKNVENIALTGNTYSVVKHYVYELAGTCSNVLMVGEIGRAINENTSSAGGKLHAASTATLTNIKCKNTVFTDDDVSIETSSTTNVDVTEDVSGSGVSF